MTVVIAICGTMGSGKTTAVENIAAALPDCKALHEDDFNKTTERSLDEIDAWWDRGANVGELDLSEVIKQLAVLCPEKSASLTNHAPDIRMNGATTTHQGTDVPRSPSAKGRDSRRIILLETHFGRLHPVLTPWIDYQCWIDVPADIAIARKVAQLSALLRSQSARTDADSGLRWIETFCKGYLSTTRKLFEMQRQKVRELSEMSIDGQGTPLAVCADTAGAISARRGSRTTLAAY
jgi:uridine kinase